VRLHEPKPKLVINSSDKTIGDLHIDRESYSVFIGNKPLNLSRKEFELLYHMASYPGKIFNREELFEKVWKKKFSIRNRTVDVHILHLRRKLGDRYISTQKGVGYRFHS
jgi:two-component system alkaline phosphatase synthesis response regulator PhoP